MGISDKIVMANAMGFMKALRARKDFVMSHPKKTEIARKMVTRYGMTEELGPVLYGSANSEVFLGRDFSATPNYSEQTAALIDSEIESIVMTQYNRALEILNGAMDKLHLVAKELFLNEKIDGDEFRAIMENKQETLTENNE